jgi:hypothetical protein
MLPPTGLVRAQDLTVVRLLRPQARAGAIRPYWTGEVGTTGLAQDTAEARLGALGSLRIGSRLHSSNSHLRWPSCSVGRAAIGRPRGVGERARAAMDKA